MNTPEHWAVYRLHRRTKEASMAGPFESQESAMDWLRTRVLEGFSSEIIKLEHPRFPPDPLPAPDDSFCLECGNRVGRIHKDICHYSGEVVFGDSL